MVISEPDDVQDALDSIGGLALGDNQEVSGFLTIRIPVQSVCKVRYHGKTSGLHILSKNRVDDRNIDGLW